MAKADHPAECPIARAAGLLGDVWTLLIVRDLCGGKRRFNGLASSLEGISTRTLSQRLKMLERAGILLRECPDASSQRVEYALTEKGWALVPLVEDLRRFGEDWLPPRSSGELETTEEAPGSSVTPSR